MYVLASWIESNTFALNICHHKYFSQDLNTAPQRQNLYYTILANINIIRPNINLNYQYLSDVSFQISCVNVRFVDTSLYDSPENNITDNSLKDTEIRTSNAYIGNQIQSKHGSAPDLTPIAAGGLIYYDFTWRVLKS